MGPLDPSGPRTAESAGTVVMPLQTEVCETFNLINQFIKSKRT